MAHFFYGLARHYASADNGREALPLLNFFGREVAAVTLAHKNRSTKNKQLATYGRDLILLDSKGQQLTRWPNPLQWAHLDPSLELNRRNPLPAALSEEDLLDQLQR